MALEISGVQRLSMIDYPHKLAATIFLPKCNFRCGFCHNPELVLEKVEKKVPEQELLEYLEKKRHWLDAVCVTGGEPTLHKELPSFLEKTKKIGYLNKVDTNGTNPKMLEELLERGLVDYLAMDIKAPLEKYGAVCSAKVDTGAVGRSAELAKKFPEYEYRTTVLPKFLSAGDFEAIGRWLNGGKKYCLQQFKDDADLLDNSLKGEKKYSLPELEEIRKTLLKYFGEVEVR